MNDHYYCPCGEAYTADEVENGPFSILCRNCGALLFRFNSDVNYDRFEHDDDVILEEDITLECEHLMTAPLTHNPFAKLAG